jgi:hypothetical protein
MPDFAGMVGGSTAASQPRRILSCRKKCRRCSTKEDKDFSGVLSTTKTALTLYSDPLDERLIEANPARKIEVPAQLLSEVCERFFSIEEVRRLSQVAHGRERIVLRIFIDAGLRAHHVIAAISAPAAARANTRSVAGVHQPDGCRRLLIFGGAQGQDLPGGDPRLCSQELFTLRANDVEPLRLPVDEALKDTGRGEKRLGTRTKTRGSQGYVAIRRIRIDASNDPRISFG